MSPSQEDLLVYLNNRVDGETPGDTLIRLSNLPMMYFDSYNDELGIEITEAWRDWLRDLGNKLNEVTI